MPVKRLLPSSLVGLASDAAIVMAMRRVFCPAPAVTAGIGSGSFGDRRETGGVYAKCGMRTAEAVERSGRTGAANQYSTE
jgi:hypothetical protein